MHCRSAKKLVFEFLDGLSDEKVQLELEQHLSECEGCEKLASQLIRSMDMLHRAPQEKLDENFAWKVRLAIHKEKSVMQSQSGSSRNLLRSWNLRYATSAVAGFMAVVVLGVWTIYSGVLPLGNNNPTAVSQPTLSLNESTTPDFDPRDGFVDSNRGQLVTRNLLSGPVEKATPGAIDAVTPKRLEAAANQECGTITHNQHIQSLEAQISVLQAHLEKCKSHTK